MKHAFHLLQRISMFACAAIPMTRLRLTTENAAATDQFQSKVHHIPQQQIGSKINSAAIQENKSQQSQAVSQAKHIQATSTQIRSMNDLRQEQKDSHKQQKEQTNHSQATEKQEQAQKTIQQDSKALQILQVSQQTQKQPTTNSNQNNNLMSLPPNTAIVSNNCPSYIIAYLQKAGLNTVQSNKLVDQVSIKNKNSGIINLNLAEIKHSYKDQLKIISNAINPPQQISTIQQAKSYLSQLQRDSYLVMAYIPHLQAYKQLMQKKISSQFDTFNKVRVIDIEQREKQYRKYALNSSSNKDNYIIVRTPETAQLLKLDTFKIGEPFLLHQTSKESGNESNYKIQGKKYLFKSLIKNFGSSSNLDYQIINRQTHFYINKVETESELYNKVRQMQMSGDKRKILLFYSQQTRQDFHNNTDKVLQEVSRLQKEKIVIIKTSNQNAIKNVFQVQPDDFATLRLIDICARQEPLFAEQTEALKPEGTLFKRQRMKGPFKVQNLCNFVSSHQWIEYYQTKKKLTQIQTISAKQLQKADNTVVLLQKATCSGCKYLQQSLGQLNSVIKTLNQDKKAKKNAIYRYRIEEPETLIPLHIRRYSIFNQDFMFTAPRVTPKLYFYRNGGYVDLKVQQSLSNLNNVAQIGEQAAHVAVLRDIINKIRLKANDL